MYKIIIIEDDLAIAQNLAKQLEKWSYTVYCVTNFKTILEEVTQISPHLILLDINLPHHSGLHWCNEIRKQSNVPILFISSETNPLDIVMAINLGGDDYITKPFNINLVLTKIQALLRRTYDFKELSGSRLLEYRGVSLDLGEMSIHYQEKKLTLSKNDVKIMDILISNAGKVVKRDTIMEKLWAGDVFIDDNTLTVNMTRLRKKLEDIGLHGFIETLRGVGYIIR